MSTEEQEHTGPDGDVAGLAEAVITGPGHPGVTAGGDPLSGMVTVRFDLGLAGAAKNAAASDGKTVSEWIRGLAVDEVRRRGEAGEPADPREGRYDWPRPALAAAIAAIDARISASLRVSAPVAMYLAVDILNAVAPLIRADERERLADLAAEHGAVYCRHRPCTCIRLGSDPTIRPFADLIRDTGQHQDPARTPDHQNGD